MRAEFIDNDVTSCIRHGKTKNAKMIGLPNAKGEQVCNGKFSHVDFLKIILVFFHM